MNKSFKKFPLNKTLQIDNIISFFYSDLGDNFSSNGETHDYWEFIYVDIGRIEIIMDDEIVILEEGYVYFHPPYQYHKHKSIISSSICNGAFYYNDIVLNDISNKPILLSKSSKTYFFNALKYSSMIFASVVDTKESIYQIANTSHCIKIEQLLLNNLESFLLDILAFDDTLASTQVTISYSTLVKEAILIMEQHIFLQLTLSTLCQKLHCSKSTLSSAFKKQTSLTVINYYINLKIDKSKELLKTYNITQTSNFLNFCNVNYFSNQFKKHTNLYPSEYCKSLKNQNFVQLLELPNHIENQN